MGHGPGFQKGTHALRKRCPECKKRRRFYEPPGDQGGAPGGKRCQWVKIGDRWICGFCAAAVKTTRTFKVNGATVTIIVEGDPTAKGPDGPTRTKKGRPTSTGLDETLMHVLTDATVDEFFAPEADKGQLKITCWAGGLAYVLSTYLRRYLGDVLTFDDPPETK